MTSSTDNISLLWDDFQGNVTKSFHELRNDSDFCDVTLACEDNQQIEAHRAVLSSCSPLLSSILRRSRHPHPLVYLWGVSLWQLKAVLDFCYRGQVMVSQLELDDFLRVARLLGIKGVDSGQVEEGRDEHEDKPKPGNDPDPESDNIEDPMSTFFIKTNGSMESKYSDSKQRETRKLNSPIYSFFTIDASNEAIAECKSCGKKKERKKLIFKESVRFSNRGMISHLRLHKEEFERWNAAQSNSVLEAREKIKKEYSAERKPSHVESWVLKDGSNLSLPLECEKESVYPKKEEVQTKSKFAEKLEEKLEKIKNMKTSSETYPVRKVVETLRFPCDYPNCDFICTREANLKEHKKRKHEKRSVPLICSRNYCTNTFDNWQDFNKHREICVLKCSWKRCGQEFKVGEKYKSHLRRHPFGREDEFEIVTPKVPSIPLNLEDMEMKLKGIWNTIK